MDHNSARFNKEDLALQRIIKDLLGETNRRPSSSIRNNVLKKNLQKTAKSTDLSSTSKCLSVTSKVVEDEKKEEKELPKGTSSESAIETKLKCESLSRDKFKLKKVKLDDELESLRRTVNRCHAAIEPVQKYTDRRLEYYRSISNKKVSEDETRKRKYKEDESENEEILKYESCEYEYDGEWTCEVEGIKIKFRRTAEEK